MTQRLRVTELDFDTIKQNLKTYLQAQSEFTDYDFEGSGLSVLLDILAYNTHYNAYYLNMVANESFLDTALLRDSVISHSKVLGYLPYSRKAPVANVNFTVVSSTTDEATVTIPKGFRFLSNEIDGISYAFVTLQEKTATKANTNFVFENLELYEGQLVTYSYAYDQATNPKQIFSIPDEGVDISSILVTVQPSSTSTASEVYTYAPDASETTTTSAVFYLQENRGQKYDLYFGNDVIGKSITDKSIVSISYLITNGSLANKANNFVVAGQTLVDSLAVNQSNFIVDSVSEAAGGAERESVDSIKFSAPLQFTTQNRLITIKDYESYIIKNYPSVDSVSVWGGEDESPPVFGTVFLSLKPKQNYYLSNTEKQRIIDDILKPKAVVAVQTIIRDPEYLYLLVYPEVTYDSKKTILTTEQLKTAIRNAVISYKGTYLNKFNSKFIGSQLQEDITAVDKNSIIGTKVIVRLQKRFQPTLGTGTSYTLYFNAPLYRGTLINKLTSTYFKVYDNFGVEREVILEEVPQSYSGISSISVINPGSGYTSAPNVSITGDGTVATAVATILNGVIQKITVVDRGTDYTRAIVTIEGGNGYGASAAAEIDAKTGTLRTVYFDTLSQKQIVDSSAGTVSYDSGKVVINNILINSVTSTDGYIRLSIEANKSIISTLKNTIITIDEDDPISISTTLETV
jgi:hypothetical protein